jgi:CheY-like chemotaxis protein
LRETRRLFDEQATPSPVNLSMSSSTTPAKLLLVDDKPGNLLALEAVLGTSVYELVFAHSGKEALELLKQHQDFALILLDVQMPELDGYEVAKRIKAMPDCRDIPIIFITAVHIENPFVMRGYQAGAIDYFSKPFDPEILRTKVGIYASFRQKTDFLKEKERQAKEAEELLRASRNLSAILESAPLGVILADADGKICKANKEGLRYWKLFEQTDDDSRVGLPGWWGRPGGLPGGIEDPLTEALKDGHDSHGEFVHRNRLDGSTRSIIASASPLRGRKGKILGAAVVIQDITPRRKIEDDLEKRIKHLVSSDA